MNCGITGCGTMTRRATRCGLPIVCRKSTTYSLGPVITIAPVLKQPSATWSGTRALRAGLPSLGSGRSAGEGESEDMRCITRCCVKWLVKQFPKAYSTINLALGNSGHNSKHLCEIAHPQSQNAPIVLSSHPAVFTFKKQHDTTVPRAPGSATSSWIEALVAEQVYRYFRFSLGSNTPEISVSGSPNSLLPPFRLLQFLPHAFRSRGSTGAHQ